MQKTGAAGAYQGDVTLPASDLGRSLPAPTPPLALPS